MITLTLPLMLVNDMWCSPKPRAGKKTPPRVLTKEGRQYKKDVAMIVLTERVKPIEGRVWVLINVHPKNPATDTDGAVKPTLDALESAGVLANDNAVDYVATDRCEPRDPSEVVVYIGQRAGKCWVCGETRLGKPVLCSLFICDECDGQIAKSTPAAIGKALRSFCVNELERKVS